MEITRVSNEGQVIIPDAMQKAYRWEVGQELIIIDTGEVILLKPKKPFPETTLNDVVGCLKYQGQPKSIEDMDDAISQGIEELLRSVGLFRPEPVRNSPTSGEGERTGRGFHFHALRFPTELRIF